jgi:hypothetical protein
MPYADDSVERPMSNQMRVWLIKGLVRQISLLREAVRRMM